MKIAIVSHSYVSAENRKNIRELEKVAQVRVVLPHAHVDGLGREQPDVTGSGAGAYRVYRRIGLPGAQYVLASADLGLRSFAPDIVHVEYDPWSTIFWQAHAYASLHAPPAARLVCTVRKNTYRRYPGPLGRAKDRLARAGIRRVHHFVAASRMVAGMYERTFGVSPRDITVTTHLGVDTDVFSPPPSGERGESASRPLHIGYCGTFRAYKGVLELFEAVKRCREVTGRELRLEYLGGGPLWRDLLERSRQHPWFRISPAVPHREVADFLRRLDVFVLPAQRLPDYEEHDAHSFLEALAVGLPCVGTRAGITPEIVAEASGVLVEPGSVAELAEALRSLVVDASRRRELGRRAREAAVRSYSLQVVAEQRAVIYQRVLAAT